MVQTFQFSIVDKIKILKHRPNNFVELAALVDQIDNTICGGGLFVGVWKKKNEKPNPI